MGLWRVLWEADVEADSPEEAFRNARDAFTVDQTDRGTYYAVEHKPNGELGELQEVKRPFEGPHPGIIPGLYEGKTFKVLKP